MPGTPSTSLATLRPDLAGSFMEFDLEADRQGFIAYRVLPILEVPEAGGVFGKVTIESLLRTRNTRRNPRSGYSRQDWEFTNDSYACQEHGAEEVVDDNLRRRHRHYFDAEQIATRRAIDAVLRNAEIRAASACFNASTFNTTGVSTEWSTVATATPITDVEAAVQRVWLATGMWPNALVINKRVFRNLRRCAQIIDLIKYSGHDDPKAENITASMLAEVFGLDEVIVAGSAKNTADKGLAASISAVWSDEYALVTRVCSSNDIEEPCIGRTMHWAEDGSMPLGTIETYREEQARGDVVRVRHEVQEKVLYAEMGELLSNITA